MLILTISIEKKVTKAPKRYKIGQIDVEAKILIGFIDDVYYIFYIMFDANKKDS